MELRSSLFTITGRYPNASKNMTASTLIGTSLTSSVPHIFFAQRPAIVVKYARQKNQRDVLGSKKWSMQNMVYVDVLPNRKAKLFNLPKSFVRSSYDYSGSYIDASMHSSEERSTNLSGNARNDEYGESLRGKLEPISFYESTLEPIDKRTQCSPPAKNGAGTLFWVVGPLALIASFLLPQVLLNNAVYAMLEDEIGAEFLGSILAEVVFYVGLGIFLFVTDHVHRSYHTVSSKHWDLITGLRGYLYSTYFTTGLKVFAPLLAVYVVWPTIGLPALVSVAAFLVSCAAQFAFEAVLQEHKSSCWPVVPIIFEVYRLYLLSRAANFIERLLMEMKGMPITPELLERSGSLISMIVVFQVLGVLCLWSLITFLLRLLPARPVPEVADI